VLKSLQPSPVLQCIAIGKLSMSILLYLDASWCSTLFIPWSPRTWIMILHLGNTGHFCTSHVTVLDHSRIHIVIGPITKYSMWQTISVSKKLCIMVEGLCAECIWTTHAWITGRTYGQVLRKNLWQITYRNIMCLSDSECVTIWWYLYDYGEITYIVSSGTLNCTVS